MIPPPSVAPPQSRCPTASRLLLGARRPPKDHHACPRCRRSTTFWDPLRKWIVTPRGPRAATLRFRTTGSVGRAQKNNGRRQIKQKQKKKKNQKRRRLAVCFFLLWVVVVGGFLMACTSRLLAPLFVFAGGAEFLGAQPRASADFLSKAPTPKKMAPLSLDPSRRQKVQTVRPRIFIWSALGDPLQRLGCALFFVWDRRPKKTSRLSVGSTFWVLLCAAVRCGPCLGALFVFLTFFLFFFFAPAFCRAT